MRLLNERVIRYNRPLIPAEGMGFSIGGFHPFRINDWKNAAKKIDAKLMNVTGLDKIKPLAKLHDSMTKDFIKLDASVSKDFQKVKKWSQEHRKQLQIAAAIAGAAVGGAFALGYLGTGAAGAAGAGAGAAEATTATTLLSSEALTVAPITASALPGVAAVAPGLVTTAGTLGTVGAAAAATATGGGLLSTVGTTLGLLGSAATLVNKLKGPAPVETVTPGPTLYDPGSFGGSWSGGGASTGLGPIFDQSAPEPVAPGLPGWVIPAALGLGLLLILRRK